MNDNGPSSPPQGVADTDHESLIEMLRESALSNAGEAGRTDNRSPDFCEKHASAALKLTQAYATLALPKHR